MKATFSSCALMALATTAWAGSICPAGDGTPTTFPHVPDAAATGCNVVITINADRSTTVTINDATPYENSEDILVGVKNNSSSSVPSISLTGGSGNDIFGLDGDGMCTFTFVGSSYCTASQKAGTDPGDYYGPNTTFVVTSSTAGTVNFTTPIPSGGTAYFSLEGVPTGGLAAGVGPPTTPAASGAPALSVWAMLVLASMLMGYSLWAIRKRRQQQG